MTERIEIKAPAKINIGLNVVRKREDGYHDLETLFYPIHSLFDTLIFQKSSKTEIKIDGELNIPFKNNLITSALNILEKESNSKLPVSIYLKKRIPVGAGLGGGSSNAATTLKAINNLFGLEFSQNKLLELALRIGSDVPLFINPVPALGKSRGELLKQINFNINGSLLIVNPGIHVSTKEAFQLIEPKANNFDYQRLAGYSGTMSEYHGEIKNDFEDKIFLKYPEIGRIKEKLLESGAEFSLMTGTGSTLFAIFENSEKAETVSRQFPENYFKFIYG